MFEGDPADTCARKFLLMLIGSQAEGLACTDRTAKSCKRASIACGLFRENCGHFGPKECVSISWSQPPELYNFYNFTYCHIKDEAKCRKSAFHLKIYLTYTGFV
jgi:hypothetical protein